MEHEHLAPLAAAGLGIVGLAGLPGLLDTISQVRKRTPKDNFYEDTDGKSSPEAVAAFSNKWPKVTILSLALIGLATSVAISVLSTLHISLDDLLLANWLTTASWVGLSLQARHITNSLGACACSSHLHLGTA